MYTFSSSVDYCEDFVPMTWKNIFIQFKPTLECLTTHQPAWDDLTMQSNREGKFCKFCKVYFYYPTRQEDKPIYRK